MIKITIDRDGMIAEGVYQEYFDNSKLRNAIIEIDCSDAYILEKDANQTYIDICDYLSSKVEGYKIRSHGVTSNYSKATSKGTQILNAQLQINW